MANPEPELNSYPFRPDTDWFNQLFAYLEIDASIKGFDSVEVGTGQIGTNIRFTFDFEHNSGGVPASLVGKFPTDNEQSRGTAFLMGHYEREVKYYETFQAVAGQIAPHAYFTHHDPGTDNFALIMEDMAPSIQGDQLAGCSLAHAERAMDNAAVLHASHWNDPALEAYPWLQESETAPPPGAGPELVLLLWDAFVERYQEHLTAQQIEIGGAYAKGIEAWGDAYHGPRCLTHGDYRLDNMLFGAADAAKPLAVVDWQTVGVRGPAIDVSYFIGAGLPEGERPKHERALVERYHKALQEGGVTGYDFDALWEDYRRFSFYGIVVAFAAAMIVERTERGDEMFLTMIRRHTEQVAGLNAMEFL